MACAWDYQIREVEIEEDGSGRADIGSAEHLPLVDQIAVCVGGIEAQELFNCPMHDHAALGDYRKVRGLLTGLADVESAISALTSDHVRIGTCRSRTNADDRLTRAALGRVEGGDGIVEGRDVADVRPQSSVPHPLDDLTQLGTIGLDNEVDRQAVGGPCLARPDDGHERSSGSNQGC